MEDEENPMTAVEKWKKKMAEKAKEEVARAQEAKLAGRVTELSPTAWRHRSLPERKGERDE